MTRTQLVAAVEAAVRERGAKAERHGEIRFRCPESAKHQNGDADPSADWNPTKAVWRCRACGTSGGVVDLARRLGIATGNGRDGARPERRRQERSRAKDVVARVLQGAAPDSGRIAAYLQSRGLSGQVPADLRLHRTLAYYNERDGGSRKFPAMVAPVRERDGKIVAVHRTYLDPKAPAKAQVPQPKKSLGPVKGGAVRLAAAGPTLALAEGIETGLAVMEATGIPTWAALSAGNLPEVNMPEDVAAIEIWGDGDKAGTRGAEETARRRHVEGRQVFIVTAPEGKDWLDVLAERGPEALREARAAATPWEPKLTSSDELAASGAPAPDPPHLTDLGNAQRLVGAHGNDLRYCAARGGWLAWDGRRWAVDETAEVMRRAKATIRNLYGHAADVEEAKERQQLAGHALRSEARRALDAMVALAASEPGIPVRGNELDADAWVLNVENGTLDLRTGELRPHQRGDLITKLAPVTYDPSARCPTFDAFLARIFDKNSDLVRFVQLGIGYSLTGSTVERLLLILWGGGKNGKTTLLESVRFVLGDYAMRTPVQTLLAKRGDGGIPNDVARLVGARFVSASEADEGKRLAEAQIKDMTGGDTIVARFMRAEFFEFRPQFKLWLATNHKPVIKGTDEAIWDRIRLIPFTVRIPESQQDKHFIEKLKAEAPGVLRWAVEGCLAWQRDGLGMPKPVEAATADYRKDMDVLGAFIDDACVLGDGLEDTTKRLFAGYLKWCETNAEKATISKRAFGLRLAERGFEETRSRRARGRRGIALLSDAVTDGDAISGLTALREQQANYMRNRVTLRHCVTPDAAGGAEEGGERRRRRVTL